MPTQRFEEKRVEERVGEGEKEREREIERKSTAHGRERECFGSSFYMFSSTWANTMQMGLSQECCLSYLKSSLWSLTFLVFF